jgi:hypothetical protein
VLWQAGFQKQSRLCIPTICYAVSIREDLALGNLVSPLLMSSQSLDSDNDPITRTETISRDLDFITPYASCTYMMRNKMQTITATGLWIPFQNVASKKPPCPH